LSVGTVTGEPKGHEAQGHDDHPKITSAHDSTPCASERSGGKNEAAAGNPQPPQASKETLFTLFPGSVKRSIDHVFC
jgi:hypothetical protein